MNTIETLVTPAGQFNYDRFHFAEATRSGGVLYCSGVIGVDDKGRIPDNIEDEFDLAWRNLGRLLHFANADYTDILECTSYHLRLREQMPAFMVARDRYLAAPWPAWTAIGTTELALPGAHVEIRVTARSA